MKARICFIFHKIFGIFSRSRPLIYTLNLSDVNKLRYIDCILLHKFKFNSQLEYRSFSVSVPAIFHFHFTETIMQAFFVISDVYELC